MSSDSKDNIEALANLLQADFKGETLDTVVENLAGAVVRFPETLKIESLADSLQETVRRGKASGSSRSCWNAAAWISIPLTPAWRQRAARRRGRTSSSSWNAGLAESYAAYVQNNQALVEAGEASFDYEQAMNDLAGTLEPARFAVLQTISDFIEENGETLEQWGQIILFVVSTIVEMLEMLASLPPSVTIIITTIILAVTIFTKVNKAINDGTGAIGQLAGAFRAANPSLMQTAMIVMMVVEAVSLLVYLLVALTEGAERASSTMDAFAKRSQSTASTVSSAVNTAKSQGKQNGFARGTASAPRGRFLVGENGPEEIELRGGERIYSATQSRARRALATGGSGGVVNNYFNLDVSKVRSMAQVVELAESAQQYNRKYGR